MFDLTENSSASEDSYSIRSYSVRCTSSGYGCFYLLLNVS